MAEQQIDINRDEGADAFGRLRVSTPTTLFSSQLQYDLEPFQFEAFNTDDGAAPAHSANTRMAALTIDAGDVGGTSGMQSYQYTPYQAGKSHAAFVTGVFGPPTANVTKRIGYFDDSNGVFFQQEGDGTYSTVLRSKISGEVTERKIEQADWMELSNQPDSGLGVNMEAAQIFHFDLQFLGMGRVRCGLDLDGKMFYVAEYKNAGLLTTPYMQTATLPIRAEVVASAGLAEAATLHLKCSEVRSEGGSDQDFSYSFSTEGTATAGNGSAVHILSLRPATTLNSLANRVLFALQTLDLIVTGTNSVKWQLCIGSTFSAAPTWAAVDATNSAFEAGTGGTVSGVGNVIMQGYVGASAQTKASVSNRLAVKYPIGLNKAGSVRANGTLSLFVTGIGGTSATRAAMNWQEVR